MNKAQLSPERSRLIELMQRINYGRIEALQIRRGEPVLDPSPRVIEDIKFGAENGARAELSLTDFTLKSQVTDFFNHLDQMPNGCIVSLEIKSGLPFKMELERSTR